MIELHGPWLELALLAPLCGSLLVRRARSAAVARVLALVCLGLSLTATVCDWVDFSTLDQFAAHDRWDLVHALTGRDLLVVDELTAPLLALVALIGFLTVLATLRTKIEHVSFSNVLLGQACCLGMLAVEEPGLVVVLVGLSVLPPAAELWRRRAPMRVYWIHMGAHIGFLLAGWICFCLSSPETWPRVVAEALLILAILIRVGIVPLHCWVPDLCEHATLGGAILFLTPMVGAYAAVRLLLPYVSSSALTLLATASVVMAVYAAGMALVQHDPRRFFCYLLLSHSAAVTVGLETGTVETLTGGLCVWFATSLSLAGFGLTLRSIESRLGRLSLDQYHGLYEHMPSLAVLFLITGLASVGFPGTIGFVAAEMLVDGAIHHDPIYGYALVAAGALNGIAVLSVYFRLFTGTRHRSSIALGVRLPERIAVLTLVVLMIGGGIYPQPFVASRLHAAEKLIEMRPRGGRAVAPHAPRPAGSHTEIRFGTPSHQHSLGSVHELVD